MRNKFFFGVSELSKDEIFVTGISGNYRNKNRTFEVRKFSRNLPEMLPEMGSGNGVRNYTVISVFFEISGIISGITVTNRKFRSKSDQTRLKWAKYIHVKNGLKNVLASPGAEIIDILCFGPFLGHFWSFFEFR